jgi:hypothetical protein
MWLTKWKRERGEADERAALTAGRLRVIEVTFEAMLNALPTSYREDVLKTLEQRIVDVDEWSVPRDVPRGYDHAYRDAASGMAQFMLARLRKKPPRQTGPDQEAKGGSADS